MNRSLFVREGTNHDAAAKKIWRVNFSLCYRITHQRPLNMLILKPIFALTMVVAAGILIGSQYGRAANDNNGAQDEKEMIQIGLATAASTGISLKITNQDPDLVGLGSYIVN